MSRIFVISSQGQLEVTDQIIEKDLEILRLRAEAFAKDKEIKQLHEEVANEHNERTRVERTFHQKLDRIALLITRLQQWRGSRINPRRVILMIREALGEQPRDNEVYLEDEDFELR